MKIKILFLIIVSLFIASAGFTQNLNTDYPLTWDDCVSMALHNNPDLASSLYDLEAAKSSYYESYNGIFPQLNLSHGYSDSDNGNVVWQTQGSINLDIFNMSQIAKIKASKSSVTKGEVSLWNASSLLRLNLRKAFLRLFFVQKDIEVSKNILDMRKEEAQLVTLRYESGRESKGNMLRANAQLLQATADFDQSVRDLRTAQRALNQQLGQDDFTVVSVTATLNVQEPPELPQDLSPLLEQRPDVVLQLASVRIAEISLSQSKSSFWPNLSANYSKFASGHDEFSSFQSRWGVTLNYPLFSGGPTATYYAVAAAKNNLEKSKQDLRSVRQQALVDLETSWSDFVGSVDQSKVQSALLEAARQRNDEANIRYDSGLMTYDNWEIIVSDRINQERQTIQSQLNSLIAEAAWGRALGKRLEE